MYKRFPFLHEKHISTQKMHFPLFARSHTRTVTATLHTKCVIHASRYCTRSTFSLGLEKVPSFQNSFAVGSILHLGALKYKRGSFRSFPNKRAPFHYDCQILGACSPKCPPPPVGTSPSSYPERSGPSKGALLILLIWCQFSLTIFRYK